MIRLGLIGAGRWGQNYLRTVPTLPGVAIVATATRSTGNWRELIDRHRCDGVIIATPPSLHAEMLAAAIQASMPALVEKPLTLGLRDALELQRMRKTSLTPVLVNHIHLFHPAYQELKRLATGVVERVDSIGGNWGPFRDDCDALWDYGPHDVAMCLDLFGEAPRTIEAERESENYRLALTFSAGSANIRVGNRMRQKVRRLTAWRDKHELVFDDLAPNKLVRDGVPATVSGTPPLACVLQAFTSGIAGTADNRFGLDLAVNVTRVLQTASDQLGAA